MAPSLRSSPSGAATTSRIIGSGLAGAHHPGGRTALSSPHAGARAWWNAIRSFALGLIAVGGAWFGIVLVTQGALYAIPLWLMAFLVSIFALVGVGRDLTRRRKLKTWLRTTNLDLALRGAEEARQYALLAPPKLQAAYYARKDEIRRLPLPKESLRALRTSPRRRKDGETSFGGCCGPR